MAKKDGKDAICWGLFKPQNRWVVGGFFVLVGLVAQGVALGFLPADLIIYWPLLLVIVGLSILL